MVGWRSINAFFYRRLFIWQKDKCLRLEADTFYWFSFYDNNCLPPYYFHCRFKQNYQKLKGIQCISSALNILDNDQKNTEKIRLFTENLCCDHENCLLWGMLDWARSVELFTDFDTLRNANISSTKWKILTKAWFTCPWAELPFPFQFPGFFGSPGFPRLIEWILCRILVNGQPFYLPLGHLIEVIAANSFW